MSVIESNRTKTVLATSVKARELASYTIKITTNTKVFLPEYRSSLTDQIVSDAVNIYRFVWLANNIRVGNDPDNTFKVIQRMNAFYKALWEDDYAVQTCDRPERPSGTGKTACAGISQHGDSGLQHHDGNP